MTKQITHKLSLLTLITVLVASLVRPLPALAVNPPVLITEVQTGFVDEQGIEFPKNEFIEITNVSGAHVNMNGWKLEYLSAANNGSTSGLTIDILTSQIAANGRGLWLHDGYTPNPDAYFGVGDVSASGLLAKSGGHIRLMNGATTIDCVAWGSAVAIGGCDKVSTLPGAGQTIQRQITSAGYDKSTGVVNLSPPTPQGGNIYSITATPPVLPPFTTPVVPIPQKDCENVGLSEILANPSGDDGTNEFIELHNLTDQNQSLYGCVIKLNNGKQYEFPQGVSLVAGEYKAFRYTTTGLQLTNSGATVTFATIGQETTTTYPAVTDDQAWAFIEGDWFITKQPTPDAVNTLAQTAEESLAATLSGEVEPCPAGKYRSLETNRCRNIVETTSVLTACAADQERNPDTGRCRKKAVVATTACPVGQERNLVTNRCRKTEVAGATTKACEAGQKRSVETGRCRKVVAPKSGAKPDDSSGPKTYHYALVGAILVGIAGYGIYEYRHDIANLAVRFKKRLPLKK